MPYLQQGCLSAAASPFFGGIRESVPVSLLSCSLPRSRPPGPSAFPSPDQAPSRSWGLRGRGFQPRCSELRSSHPPGCYGEIDTQAINPLSSPARGSERATSVIVGREQTLHVTRLVLSPIMSSADSCSRGSHRYGAHSPPPGEPEEASAPRCGPQPPSAKPSSLDRQEHQTSPKRGG